jgi:pyoverdine/dityrosine biosynthesis protein Dit1
MAEYRYYLIPDAMTRAFPEQFEKQTPTEFFDNIADLKKRYADYLERRAPHYRAAGSRPDHRAIQRFMASANDLPSDEETKRKRDDP